MKKHSSEMAIATWLKTAERWVRRTSDGSSAALRCRLHAPPEKVWKACTDGAQLRRWFAKVNGEIREGATVMFDVGASFDVTSRILWHVPYRLAFTWSYPGREADEVEIRLQADGDGTLLELEQRSKDNTDWWFGAGAGWESALIRLELLLQGDDPRMISDEVFDRTLGPLWIEAGRPSAS